MAKFNFTLLLCLFLVLALAADASTFGSQRRDHGRLLKKRADAVNTPADDSSGSSSQGQGQQTPSSSAAAVQPTQATSAVAETTPASSAAAQTTPQAVSSASPGSVSTTGLIGALTSELSPSQSSVASSAAAATTPSMSNTAANTPQTSDQPAQASGANPSNSILYLTTSSAATPSQTNTNEPSSGISHTAVTILIVIAASVGASVIGWTIIRKWKFRPSSDFDSRMQPIDWHPDGNNEDVGGRRLSRASSFHSGSANGVVDDEMRGMGAGAYAPSLTPIPDHDFTAGPAHLAPVGGYADLARGPSPQPMMQEPLGRSLTVTQPAPQYDQFGVPLHHGYSGY